MKISIKKQFGIIAIVVVSMLSACSAGNKVIPDLFDITKIDSTNDVLSFFTVYGVGDTSFAMEVNSLDSLALDIKNTVQDDTIKIFAFQANGTAITTNGIFISTYGTLPGVYSLDTIGGNPPKAGVLVERTTGGISIFQMNRGFVQIREIDSTAKTIKGDLDVNNYANRSGKKLRVKAYFYMKYI